MCVTERGTTLPNKKKIGFSGGVSLGIAVQEKEGGGGLLPGKKLGRKHQESCFRGKKTGVSEEKSKKGGESEGEQASWSVRIAPALCLHTLPPVDVCACAPPLPALALTHTPPRAHTTTERGR